MNEAWERAVEAALLDQTAPSSSSSAAAIAPRVLTLDSAVKCLHGRLPPPALFERYQTLERLSIANVGVSSLEKFPKLRNLQRLSLSDNRIAGGLQFLVEAGLVSLRDLDLSNNRIQSVEDLEPLAQLRIVSLDLYECPVTRIADYRARVFGMIRSLKYLDKLDVNENERAESDDEDDYEDEEEEEVDPGSGEVDGDDRVRKLVSGVEGGQEDVGFFDEDVDSDADEETIELNEYHRSNGFRVAAAGVRVVDVEVDEDEHEEDVEYDGEDEDEDEDGDLGEEEIDEDNSDEEDVVEAHDMRSSDADIEEVEVEEEDNDEEDGDGEDDEDVEDEEDGEAENIAMSTDGEIDGHEHGEGDDDDDENGEIGEDDDHGIEEGGGEVQVGRDFDDDGEDEDEDGAEFLVQPVSHPVNENGGSDVDASDDEDEDEDEDEVDDGAQDQDGNRDLQHPPSASHPNKRKRDEDSNIDDDGVDDLRSSRHHR